MRQPPAAAYSWGCNNNISPVTADHPSLSLDFFVASPERYCRALDAINPLLQVFFFFRHRCVHFGGSGGSGGGGGSIVSELIIARQRIPARVLIRPFESGTGTVTVWINAPRNISIFIHNDGAEQFDPR